VTLHQQETKAKEVMAKRKKLCRPVNVYKNYESQLRQGEENGKAHTT